MHYFTYSTSAKLLNIIIQDENEFCTEVEFLCQRQVSFFNKNNIKNVIMRKVSKTSKSKEKESVIILKNVTKDIIQCRKECY